MLLTVSIMDYLSIHGLPRVTRLPQEQMRADAYVPSPAGGGRGFRNAPAASQPNRSSGRYPDGVDTDFNCRDFSVQNTITLSVAAPAGSDNIKVASVTGISIGQKVIVDAGENSETAVVAVIGTTGGTTVGTATTAGATVIPVANVTGFSAGQSITIDNGTNLETAVVASVTAGRPNFGGGNNQNNPSSVTVTMPLAKAHDAGVQVSGSGLTFASPLNKDHASGAQIASNVPTPGEPNQYIRRP